MYTYYDDATIKIEIEGSEHVLGTYWIYCNGKPVAYGVDVDEAKREAAQALADHQIFLKMEGH